MIANIMSAEEFAERVIAEAEAQLLDVIVVVDGLVRYTGDINKVLYGNNGQTAEVSIEPTFADLQKYIKLAEVNEVGIHVPIIWTSETEDSAKYFMHIYSNKRQVNFIRAEREGEQGDPIYVIYFDNDEATLYNVDPYGRADYDHPYRIPTDTPVSEIIRHGTAGINGKIVVDLMWKLLSNPVNTQEISKKITFDDFYRFCKRVVAEGDPFVYHDSRGGKWTLSPINTKDINTKYMNICMTYSGRGVKDTRVAAFLFYMDNSKVNCRLVACNKNGELMWNKRPNDPTKVVNGSTRIDVPDPPFKSEDCWEDFFNINGNTSGLKIRETLWNILG